MSGRWLFTTWRDGVPAGAKVPIYATTGVMIHTAAAVPSLPPIQTGPTVAVSTPAALSLFTTRLITVTGTIGDPQGRIFVNGVQGVVNANGTWTISNVVLRTEGINTLEIVGSRRDSNVGTRVTRDVEFDPPVSVDHVVEQGKFFQGLHEIVVPTALPLSYTEFLSGTGISGFTPDSNFHVIHPSPKTIGDLWTVHVSGAKATGIYIFDYVFRVRTGSPPVSFDDLLPIRVEVVPAGTMP